MAHYKGAASEGGRAQILIKKRQKEQEELEIKKKKIEEDLSVGSIQNKFATHYDAIEQQLKSNTIGKVFFFFILKAQLSFCLWFNAWVKSVDMFDLCKLSWWSFQKKLCVVNFCFIIVQNILYQQICQHHWLSITLFSSSGLSVL